MAPRRDLRRWLVVCLCAALLLGCGGSGSSGNAGTARGPGSSGSNTTAPGGNTGGSPPAPSPAPAPQPIPPAAPLIPTPVAGTALAMEFSAVTDFYARPFPCESRRRANGKIDLDYFPGQGIFFVDGMLSAIRNDALGFGLSSTIYFRSDAAIDPASLPDLPGSLSSGATVFLLGVDPQSPDYLQRAPVEVEFHADAGPFGDANLLSLLPLQGRPLRPERLYAAVVMRSVRDAAGDSLGVSLPLAQVVARVQPAGMSAAAWNEYEQAVDGLQAYGVALSEVAGLAVFRTGKPRRELETVKQHALNRGLPQPLSTPAHVEDHPGYCLYKTTINLPSYQGGVPPYLGGGGAWQLDANRQPILHHEETAELFFSIPHQAMPATGFPAVVLVRTGFGDAVPLTDRGVHAVSHGSAPPGTGPAQEFAQAGFMGVQLDGPHGGLRNITGLDEQLLIFNFSNPVAMRDNLRQAALELILLAEVLPTLSIPASCPNLSVSGGGPVVVDAARLALFGHSMGATIAPLALALQPRYKAAILSGAGGSWIENIMHKQSPLPIKPMAELMLGYNGLRQVYTHDPALCLLQWAGEPADPPVYGRYITDEPLLGDPRHVLMLQGIIDTYIMPSIANATSLSLGLDLAGPSLDQAHPGLSSFTPLADLLSYGGRSQLSLPVSGNRWGAAGAFTAVVVQHPEDGIEDGHETVFQTELPKYQYRCFLRSFAQGQVPHVHAPSQFPNCP